MNLIFVTIFFSFISNFIWENLHSKLYAHHLGKQITQRVLFIATLGDVLVLGVFSLLWHSNPFLNKNIWIFVPLGLFVALIIEKYALSTHRWAYTKAMPIVPYLNVGVSPFLQLAVTSVALLLILKSIQI